VNVNGRIAEYSIDPLFLERWSPRAFTAEPMARETLLTMLEAARWAASSFNAQPWRFIYALRETPQWHSLLGLLIPFNQAWAKQASALVLAVSKTTSRSPRTGEEHLSLTHSFDAGAACAYMVLQAHKLGWHAHGMVGFDHERAREVLSVPDGFALEAVFAIGRLGNPSSLEEALQTREKPSDRLPLAQLVFEGHM
jgi:nitroreductase